MRKDRGRTKGVSATFGGFATNDARRLATMSGVAALVLIAGVAFLVYTSISSLVNSRKMVDHTYAVIDRLDQLLIDLENAESQQRGYVITGDTAFLGENDESKWVLRVADSLRVLVADDPHELKNLERLRGHVNGKLVLIDSIILVRATEGHAAAAAIIQSGRGRIFMDSVHATVAVMKSRETTLLRDRREREHSSLRRATVAGSLGVLAASLLGLAAVLLVQRILAALVEGRRNAIHAKALLNATSEGIYGLDSHGAISFVNPAITTILGYTREELLGKTAHKLLHHTRQDGEPYPTRDCPIYKILQEGGTGVYDNEIVWKKDGSSIPVEYSANQMLDNDGNIGAVVTFREITDRQIAEAALRSGKEMAESANQAKSDFLARMSHELRTPLNSVIGFSSVLLRNKGGNLRDQQIGYLERIRKNGVHLLSLINDILDLSKIEAGRMEVDKESVDLQRMVHEVIAGFETQVHEKRIALDAVIPERVSPLVTDAAKLHQVLLNLVGNAIKFTDEGGVQIRIVTDPATNRPIALFVTDSGIGIPPDRIEAIFDAFEQAEKSITRRYGGTGLGLPICRSLCDLLGYELSVSSEAGKGSTFTVDMRPVPKLVANEVLPVPEASAAGVEAVLADKLVLIIDDDSDSRTLIAHQVAALGGRSAGSSGGVDALRLAREIKPDLITLDLMMPGMDGWDVMQALKADQELREIPVIIVSLVAREHGRGMVGAMSVLSKPLDRESLAQVLTKGVGVGRVLVVEDDADTQYLLSAYLYEEGAAEVRIVAGANDAIRALEEFHPDLILLDMVATQGGGEGFLQALGRLQEGNQPQVIIVTGQEVSSSIIENLEVTPLSVVSKGRDLEENLKRCLREFSGTRRLTPVRPAPQFNV